MYMMAYDVISIWYISYVMYMMYMCMVYGIWYMYMVYQCVSPNTFFRVPLGLYIDIPIGGGPRKPR